MSAYIEAKAHIDALVTLAGWGPDDRPSGPLINYVPGYSEADTWSIDDEKVS